MIVISARMSVRPDQRQRAIDSALTMAAASEAESGCQAYRFGADLSDPNQFHLFECWDSAEVLEAHFSSPHMAAFARDAGEVLAGPVEGTRFEVSGSAPLF